METLNSLTLDEMMSMYVYGMTFSINDGQVVSAYMYYANSEEV